MIFFEILTFKALAASTVWFVGLYLSELYLAYSCIFSRCHEIIVCVKFWYHTGSFKKNVPIYLDIIIGNLKRQIIPTSSSIRIFTLKYTKNILKNTEEKSENRKFQFLALKTIL